VGLRVAKQLTHNCKCAYGEIRSLGLSNSVPEKLAKLILQWAQHPLEFSSRKTQETAIRVTLTQEEIAQLTGTSRETVSRVLGGFRKKGWLRVKGATWTIVNRHALESLVTT
jgi:CRP/FNR family transcriptional regulator